MQCCPYCECFNFSSQTIWFAGVPGYIGSDKPVTVYLCHECYKPFLGAN